MRCQNVCDIAEDYRKKIILYRDLQDHVSLGYVKSSEPALTRHGHFQLRSIETRMEDIEHEAETLACVERTGYRGIADWAKVNNSIKLSKLGPLKIYLVEYTLLIFSSTYINLRGVFPRLRAHIRDNFQVGQL